MKNDPLLLRLVDHLPLYSNGWSESYHFDHDLDTFHDYSEDELNRLRDLLDLEIEECNIMLNDLDKEILVDDEPSDGSDIDFCVDDNDHLEISSISPMLLGPITEFSFEGIPDIFHSIIQATLSSNKFSQANTYQEQVEIIVEDLIEKNDISWGIIGKLFQKNKATLFNIYKRIQIGKKNHGRPKLLSEEIMNSMENYIIEQYNMSRPVMFNNLLSYFEKEHKICLLPNTLYQIINKSKNLKKVKAKPMECERVEFNETEMLQYFNVLESLINGIPSSLIVNIDESGFQSWCDAHNDIAIVPIEHQTNEVFFSIDRSEKRSTLIAGIAANGNSLKPLIIIPRKSFEIELYEVGYTQETCILVHQENGYINTTIFFEWIHRILIPYFETERKKINYQGYAILLMDGCSSHKTNDIEEILFDNGIIVQYLPAHTSDQVQPLDVGIFHVLKQAMSRIHPPTWMNQQTKQIYKILGGLHAVTTPPNIISAFSQCGIETIWNSEH